MKNLYLHILALLFALPAFSQTPGKDGKQPVPPPPLDAKMAEVVKTIESKMVQVPGGEFTMGCFNALDSECVYFEKPRHKVTIATFYMAKYDVTQKEWKDITGKQAPGKYCAECPVVNVTWFEAQEFINKLNQLSGKNFRLPTEAEWEYAAKGGNQSHGFKYSGSNDAMEVAWYDTLISHEIHPVGKKKANELGLYDMSGDDWQWCSDWFDEKYYSTSPSNNPQGPQNMVTDNKAVRGGSWWGPMRDTRVATRDKWPPESKDDDVGFRIAMK